MSSGFATDIFGWMGIELGTWYELRVLWLRPPLGTHNCVARGCRARIGPKRGRQRVYNKRKKKRSVSLWAS